jgi:adenine-specific DNA-methyltransferase
MSRYKKQKLELTWIGKDEQPKLEPRILIEDSEKSYGDKNAENMLIYGDNLLALKALEQDFAGKIKCIYIDPPFNTGAAFEHYDDGLEHSIWLTLMRDRLEILKKLLRPDGSIYVHIDNNEQAYLKVLMDEIFRRQNFIQMISVKRASPAGFKVINPGPLTVTDYILLYAKDKEKLDYKPLRIPVPYDENYDLYIINPNDRPEEWMLDKLVNLLYKRYNFRDWRDARAEWGSSWKIVRNSLLGDIALEMKDHVVSVRDPHKPSNLIKEMLVKSKKNPNKIHVIKRENNNPIYIYNGGSLSFYKDKLREINGKLTPTELLTDFWDDINFAGIAKEGGVQFKNSKKPEMLVRRILELSTCENDWVLDSFLGSGTTAAVAHKMGRKWIGIELGEHCHTHCLPRLKQVVDGTDQGGISKAVNWKGGGGFKYYYLAPSLLKQDKYGNWIIDERYNADMLAAAMAKHEGFKYSPDEHAYWKQGQSTEKDFIFTTTNFVTVKELDRIHDEMQPDESLLICCKSFSRACTNRYPNITVKKIPNMLLGRCEFGREDYSLNIVNMPVEEDEPEFVPEGPPEDKKIKKAKDEKKQLEIFEK